MAKGSWRTLVRAGVALAVLACSCAEAQSPKIPTRKATPACPRGTLSTELDKLLPPLSPVTIVTLVPPTVNPIDGKIEPGCVVPFRREPDDRLVDVGRVVAKVVKRSAPGSKAINLGRGRFEVGRRALRLQLWNDAGDETIYLRVDGAHVHLREKGATPWEGDVSLAEQTDLPLPLDAIIAAIDRCDGDERLGKTEDSNIIEARRGALPIWRSRYVDANQTMVIDTSVACGTGDTRFLWRTAVGDILPSMAVASVRSDRVLLIARQGIAQVEDHMDDAWH